MSDEIRELLDECGKALLPLSVAYERLSQDEPDDCDVVIHVSARDIRRAHEIRGTVIATWFRKFVLNPSPVATAEDIAFAKSLQKEAANPCE